MEQELRIYRRYTKACRNGYSEPTYDGDRSKKDCLCVSERHRLRTAGVLPDLNAAVSFYGGAPSDAVMEKIKAPVLAFYGENDERVTATAEPAAQKMKALGKSFEYYVYPRATHAFITFQDMGGNGAATADSWPRAIAFLNRNLK
jgi:dienelactone hydrolase